MEFEYSKNPQIIERVKQLKQIKLTYKLIEIFLFFTILNFFLINDFDLMIVLMFSIAYGLGIGIIEFVCNKFITNNVKDTLTKELNPKLFIDCNIYLYNINKKNKKLCSYILCDIATGYFYDGNFDKCEEIIAYIEEQKLDKMVKVINLQQKMKIYYFKKKYKKVLEIKSQLLSELENYNNIIKDQILADIDTTTAMVEEDKEKLNIILKRLRKSDNGLDKVDYLYIKSQFFEEKDNKYQKKLAFEGGDIFYAKEELEDQSITTKNNIKPEKHKWFKTISISILVVLIITTILSFIACFL